jgi:predicted exporter
LKAIVTVIDYQKWASWPLAIALFLGLGLWSFFHFKVTTDIVDFLPETDDKTFAYLSRNLADSAQTRTTIVAIGGADSDVLRNAADQLSQALSHHPEVASITRGVDPQSQKLFFNLYFPRRYLFFTDRPNQLASTELSDAGLSKAARALKNRLASPAGMLIRPIADADPFQAFPQQLDRMQSARPGSLSLVNDQFFTPDKQYAIIFVTSRASGFSADRQRVLLSAIDLSFKNINRQYGNKLSMELSGVSRFTVATERSVENDIQRISIVETIAILALFLTITSSFRYVFLLFVPLIGGMIPAVTAVLFIYGRLHGLTLAFGATIAGVCIDYPIYFLNYSMLDSGRSSPMMNIKKVWPALLMASFTTAFGLAALAWTSFPGIREIALFSSINVLSALFITRWLLPRSLPATLQAPIQQRWLTHWLEAGLLSLRGLRRWLALFPLAAIALLIAGFFCLQWSDDLQKLSPLPEKLVAEDQKIRERISSVDMSRFVVALGKDEEEALELNDRVFLELEKARNAGEIEAFYSLHQLVRSKSLQKRSQDAFQKIPDLYPRLQAALEREGFDPSKFQKFSESLNATVDPLTPADLAKTPLGSIVSSFIVRAGDRVGVITFLRGIKDVNVLNKRLKGFSNVSFFDQKKFIQDLYSKYREQIVQMVLVGLVLVFLVLFFRYRKLRPSLAAFMPAILAAGCAMAILAIFGVKLNLLHVMSSILVLSMGVDFGVFMVESARDNNNIGPALISILMSGIMAVLSFGLLAMSAQPALTAIGQIAALGMFFAIVLSPIALIVLNLRGDK